MFLSEYNEIWPEEFEQLRKELSFGIKSYIAIHHVGSTSIYGMYAKPIIDIDIEIMDYSIFKRIEDELNNIGYIHCGNQGIKEREVFKRNNMCWNKTLDSIQHHLYVCPSNSEELKKHILFRDYLRNHYDIRDEYIRIKKEIINKYGKDNREKYVEVKENEYHWFFDKIIKTAMNEQ
jgi:GrpB-like predicted nucleotidyltransferase (UPF0157 family)